MVVTLEGKKVGKTEEENVLNTLLPTIRRVKAVECSNIWMSYKTFFGGRKIALRDVSVDIDESEIFGILGPNAAGKTTLISILSTLLIPDSGEVKILGMDAFGNTTKIREKINMSGGLNLPWSLSVYECLRFFGMAYGVKRAKIEELIEDFELSEFRDVEFEELSTGNKQKLSLAKTFINDPELVFLDEPTTGLDPDVALKIRRKIKKIHKERGITIVLTTHYMAEAEMLCDRIAFLNKGKIIAEGTQKELKRIISAKDRIVVELNEKLSRTPPLSEGIYSVEERKGKIIFYVDDGERRLKDIFKILQSTSNLDSIESVYVEESDLEDVFIELSKRA